MKRIVAAALLATLAACGGGGDNNNAVPKITKVSFYGQPLTQAGVKATAHAAIIHDDASAPVAASAPDAASDPLAGSVATLQALLDARNVPIQVSSQTVNASTLHAIIMGENNGLPPTPDQFTKDPSEWLVTHFVLDDMVSNSDDPAQMAAVQQFRDDLVIFFQRAHVSGKLPFFIKPISTCELAGQSGKYSAADLLTQAEGYAASVSFAYDLGGTYSSDTGTDPATYATHLGADCMTPDDYIVNKQNNLIADQLAARYTAQQAAEAGK